MQKRHSIFISKCWGERARICWNEFTIAISRYPFEFNFKWTILNLVWYTNFQFFSISNSYFKTNTEFKPQNLHTDKKKSLAAGPWWKNRHHQNTNPSPTSSTSNLYVQFKSTYHLHENLNSPRHETSMKKIRHSTPFTYNWTCRSTTIKTHDTIALQLHTNTYWTHDCV